MNPVGQKHNDDTEGTGNRDQRLAPKGGVGKKKSDLARREKETKDRMEAAQALLKLRGNEAKDSQSPKQVSNTLYIKNTPEAAKKVWDKRVGGTQE